MTKKIFFHIAILSLLFVSLSIETNAMPLSSNNASNYQLDSSATISLLTCEPGDEIYSTFGHSAFSIQDTVRKIDRVYNYGTFSYDDDFLYKFIKGDLDYFLSISNLEEFMWEYEMENRGVTQQVLRLSQTEKEKLYELLEVNYFPENRVYHYDFLFDNCSTRLRDILEKAVSDKLKYDFSFITLVDKAKNQSYRNMIDECADRLKWLTFGMDLMIGVPSDKTATPREHLFLPNNLMNAYFFATKKEGTSTEPFVLHTSALLKFDKKKEATPFIQSPLFVFILFLVLVVLITIFELKRGKWFKTIDITFSLLFGVLGCLFVFMWTSTRHNVAYFNLNILWANPILIIVAFLLLSKKYRLISWLALLYAVVNLLLILSWRWLLPQDFNIAMLPLFIAFAIRSLYVYYYNQKRAQSFKNHRNVK